MLSAADNELLTRTGPGTAMGEYFRRFWQPVALSRELPEPDGPPIRVKVMDEDLVAFRDTGGRVGLIEPHCAHRGANLFFGRNEESGIRCIYHGWKYDVDGRCVDMPNVPAGSGYHGKIAIKAYPTREFGDMVWAYLGPRERAPEDVPQLECGVVPASHRYVTKRLMECNWAHAMEGALDTAHFSFLHMPAPTVRLERESHRARRRGPPAVAPQRPAAAVHDRRARRRLRRGRRAQGGRRRALLAHHPVHAAGALGDAVGHAGRDLLRLYLGADHRRIVLGLRLRLASGPAALRRKSAPASRKAAGARWPSSGRGSCRSATVRTTT